MASLHLLVVAAVLAIAAALPPVKVLTLQRPVSERDAEMTDTFARLQDIYGNGQVLGILSKSVKQSPPSVNGEAEQRVRRAADEPTSSLNDENPPHAQESHVLFNGSGIQNGAFGALVRSTGWPELVLVNGTRVRLDSPVGEQQIRLTRLYSILIVNFADDSKSRERIQLRLVFKRSKDWWSAVSADVYLPNTVGRSLSPAAADTPAAMLGKAYRCGRPLVYRGEDGTMLTFPDIQMQVNVNSTEEFAEAVDCADFIIAPLWASLLSKLIDLFLR